MLHLRCLYFTMRELAPELYSFAVQPHQGRKSSKPVEDCPRGVYAGRAYLQDCLLFLTLVLRAPAMQSFEPFSLYAVPMACTYADLKTSSKFGAFWPGQVGPCRLELSRDVRIHNEVSQDTMVKNS